MYCQADKLMVVSIFPVDTSSSASFFWLISDALYPVRGDTKDSASFPNYQLQNVFFLCSGWDNAGISVCDAAACAAKDWTDPTDLMVFHTSLYWPECNLEPQCGKPWCPCISYSSPHYVILYLWCLQCFIQQKLVRLKSAPGGFSISFWCCTSKQWSHSPAVPREVVSYFGTQDQRGSAEELNS